MLKLLVLKCPECNANLEIEEGRSFCFCQYCGCKIIFDDENKNVTFNKNVNINKNSTYTERYINEAEVIKEKTKAKGDKLIVIFLAIMFLLGFGTFGTMKYSSNSEEKKLESIVDEVMLDIKEGNYDEAYIKANTLHYTSDWSSDIEKKWDETRESLLEQIENAEEEKKDKNSFFDWLN
ncbi:MAG: hypothetical protein RR531_13875 [Longicatena sp.]